LGGFKQKHFAQFCLLFDKRPGDTSMSGLTIGVAFDQSLLMDYYHNSIRSGMCQLIGTLKKQEPNARLHASYFNHDYDVM
jgi:hypothetical protein